MNETLHERLLLLTANLDGIRGEKRAQDLIVEAVDEIKRLTARLEIHPEAPAYDGIACRDETIRLLDEKCDRYVAYVEGSVNLLRQIEQTLAPFPDALDALEAPRHGDEIADVLVAVRAALAHPIAAALAKNPVQDDAHRVFPKSLALIEEAQAALGAVHEIVNVEDAGYHARVDALDLIGKCEGDFLDDYEWTDGDEHYHAPSTQEMGLIRDAIAGLHADEKWVEAWDAWRALVREYHANPLHGVGTAPSE